MPTIPFNTPYASQFGFRFNFVDAFNETATAQGIPINTSFSTLQQSLGAPTDLYPTQQTAWGRANQAYAHGGSGSLPAGSVQGEWVSYNGTDWVAGGARGNVNVGWFAGNSNQVNASVAIGDSAGMTNQGNNTGFSGIAIGHRAGFSNQGGSCIAIGASAGEDNQHDNTIVLNATGSGFNSAQPSGLYIKPVRLDYTNTSWLTYNPESGEINYDDTLPPSLGSSNDAASLGTSVWAYAKQAEVDAQAALTRTSFSNINVNTIYSADNNSAIEMRNNEGGSGLVIGTNTNNMTIAAGGNMEISSGGSGNPTAYTTLTTKVLNINVGNTYGALGEVLTSQGSNCVWAAPAGNVGTSSDSASLNTTLWAYAKQAEIDAQNAATQASTALSNAATANTTLSNLQTPNAIGQLGSSADSASLTTSVWAYAKQAEIDAQTGITNAGAAQTVASAAAASVGTLGDVPSLTTTAFAYAKQAEVDAQTGITAVGSIIDTPSITGSAYAYARAAYNQAVAAVPNDALQSKIKIIPFAQDAPLTLFWTPGHTSTINVPLEVSPSTTCLAPIAPADNSTGWRFTKTYSLIAVGTTPLTLGATYTIITAGTTNWTLIGASANTAGVQFTYNGAAITPSSSTGTCQSATKMSWYSRNMLWAQSLPVLNTGYSNISKTNLANAWFLVKFAADIALQGSLAIQIDTYAFKYASNTSNAYTGRWAYSFPNQQSSGFTAGSTTNLTTSPTIPRLRAGFTYLLYAADDYPSYSPTTYTGNRQYLPYGAGLFPSQNNTSNTLRDPYDIYPQYPHFAMSGCMYSSNAIQPPYGTGQLYQDDANVEVAAIYLNTSSTSPGSGVGQTVIDYTVLDWGYAIGPTTVNTALTWTPSI